MTSSNNINIKKPALSDLPNLIELWRGQYKYHHYLDSTYYVPNSPSLDKKFEEYLKQAIEKNDPNILVAEMGNRLVGFITYEKTDADYFDTNFVEHGDVLELFITPEFRNKDVGKKLMNEVEETFQKDGIKFMSLQCSTFNKNALRFYKEEVFTNRQSLLYKKI